MGRQQVQHDFYEMDQWRIFRIMAEFVEGFDRLGFRRELLNLV